MFSLHVDKSFQTGSIILYQIYDSFDTSDEDFGSSIKLATNRINSPE